MTLIKIVGYSGLESMEEEKDNEVLNVKVEESMWYYWSPNLKVDRFQSTDFASSRVSPSQQTIAIPQIMVSLWLRETYSTIKGPH